MNRYPRNRSHTTAESVTLTVSDDSCLLLIRKKIVSEKKPGFAPMVVVADALRVCSTPQFHSVAFCQLPELTRAGIIQSKGYPRPLYGCVWMRCGYSEFISLTHCGRRRRGFSFDSKVPLPCRRPSIQVSSQRLKGDDGFAFHDFEMLRFQCESKKRDQLSACVI